MTKEKKIVIQTLRSHKKELREILKKHKEESWAYDEFEEGLIAGQKCQLESIINILAEKIRKLKEVK